MKEWLDEAKAKGIPKVFITFHYPVFARAGLGPEFVAFIVWWSFLVGHVLVNIMGFEA